MPRPARGYLFAGRFEVGSGSGRFQEVGGGRGRVLVILAANGSATIAIASHLRSG